MGLCSLCQKSRQLCDSHILPEWAYTITYRKNGKFIPIRIKERTVGKEEQKGYREKLLCVECERKISVWEDYSKHLFYSIVNEKYRNIRKEVLAKDMYILHGINYYFLKQFLLSILWRMNICSNEMFSGYKISNVEELRNILLNDVFTKPSFYPISLTKLTINGNSGSGVLLTYKEHYFVNGMNRYRIVLSGIIIDYFISIDSFDPLMSLSCINENGDALISFQDIYEWESSSEMKKVMHELDVKKYYK